MCTNCTYHIGETVSSNIFSSFLLYNIQLRRFALAFIHSHSGATGVFRNAFMEFVAEATSCLLKTLQTT